MLAAMHAKHQQCVFQTQIRDFGTRQWTPLREESRAYLEALRAMMDLLDAAERDTEY